MFQELLARVGPKIARQDTNFREALPPGRALANLLPPEEVSPKSPHHQVEWVHEGNRPAHDRPSGSGRRLQVFLPFPAVAC